MTRTPAYKKCRMQPWSPPSVISESSNVIPLSYTACVDFCHHTNFRTSPCTIFTTKIPSSSYNLETILFLPLMLVNWPQYYYVHLINQLHEHPAKFQALNALFLNFRAIWIPVCPWLSEHWAVSSQVRQTPHQCSQSVSTGKGNGMHPGVQQLL